MIDSVSVGFDHSTIIEINGTIGRIRSIRLNRRILISVSCGVNSSIYIKSRIRAGYERRYEEFRDGIIEEGEGLLVGQLPYVRANDPERLWPLLTEKNGESIIKQIDPYDNAYRIFKGTLK